MKAAVLIGFGGLDRLEVREVDEPIVGPGEVKVRVVATSINPLDWKLREGVRRLIGSLELPAILGCDAAGEVVEVGEGVTRLRVGSRVAGFISRGYAERVVAREEAWAEVPESMVLADAAAIPLAALSGAQLVDEGVRPGAGDSVLITGAVGSVGRVAVYTAKARGAKVWAGVRSSQRSAAAALGVDGIVALDEVVAREEVPIFDAIADTVGGEAVARLLDKVRTAGVFATLIPEPTGAKERALEIRAVRAHLDPERLRALLRAVADGRLVIPIAKRFALSQIREAQGAAEKGAGGKVLVLM
jgi:NADPH:quinone reductase-like Zn-dependent oxidoreductase